MATGKVIVVGGGLGGLMSVIKAAESGAYVTLVSLTPARRCHSVCAQGGINASVNTKGEGDSPEIHTYETIYGGDFLANQTPVKGMCEMAPAIIFMLDRMGVSFNRTQEGLLDFRRFGGTLFHRTAYAGATTGQQMVYALDDQVRRLEDEGLVERYDGWDFLSLVLDSENVVRGITMMCLADGSVSYLRGDAVILSTGGFGYIFGKTTNSITNTGGAFSRVYQQGAFFGNPEFVQVHPTAMRGTDKLRLISESVRGEGGRVWTYKNGQKWYFLEEMFPKYGNLVPRDIASRTIYKIVVEMGYKIEGRDVVYLDITHLNPNVMEAKLGGVLEIYRKFAGKDPLKVPMEVFPAIHYTMGGLWVDFNQMSNIPGLFGAGEVEYQYHGANRLGANSLLSCLYGGFIAGNKSVEYINNLKSNCVSLPSSIYEQEVKRQQEINQKFLNSSGTENAILLFKELSKIMSDNVTIVRYNSKLKETEEKIKELKERFKNIGLPDKSLWMNQSLSFARHLSDMFPIAEAVVKSAIVREESRGAHYKPEAPNRNDENWLKTTKAKYTTDGPVFEYEPVDTSVVKPVERRYDK